MPENSKLQQQADERASIEDLKKLQAESDKADAEAAKIAEEDRIAGLQYNTARVLQINKAEQDIKKADAAAEIELKKAQTQETMKLMGDLSSFVAKDSIAGKALGIATATINTYQGASEALKQKSTLPSPFDVIAKVANVTAIIATGIKTVKSIASVQMPGGGGGGIPSLSNISPIIPQVPQAATTNISQESINDLGNKAVRAYVIESDVTSNQQRITAIRQRARFS